MTVISIDIRMIHASGIGTYIGNLVPRVIEKFPEIHFHLLGNSSELKNFSWANSRNVTIIECNSRIYSLKEQVELIRKIPKDSCLFWSPHYNIPLLYSGKLLVTVHDVFHLAMPQYVGGLHKRLYAKAMFGVLRRKASAIVCVSHFTAQELQKFTGTNSDKIFEVHNGVNAGGIIIESLTKPLNRSYLLYVGNVKPHKNLMGLLNAFELIMNKIPHDLVVVGKKDGFITGDREVMNKASRLVDRVHFTGVVTENVLQQYYAHAEALVFPSFYEGFGLPPLEAMALGCPVIVSDAASLPEVCGDAALYCDPYNSVDIAEKILCLISDPGLQTELRRKGIEQIRQYSWEKCIVKTCKIISNIIYNS